MKAHELPGNIFTQPWWLDVVAPNCWEDIQIVKGGEIFARMPIVKKKSGGVKVIEMPVLTQKLGPYIKQVSKKRESIHSNERSTLKALIEKLPEFDRLSYILDSSVVNYLPFLWGGFNQHSLTTFRISKDETEDQIWKNFNSAVRRDILRAEEALTLRVGTSTKNLYETVRQTFARQSLPVPYPEELLSSLYEEASKRDRATILEVCDEKNQIHAAQLYVHDDTVTYYLSGGLSESSNVPGAASLLIWNGIKEALNRNNTFDFEGSSKQSIERYFSSFGATPYHLHHIQGYSNKYQIIKSIKDLVKALKFNS